jgi:hypothetical protein
MVYINRVIREYSISREIPENILGDYTEGGTRVLTIILAQVMIINTQGKKYKFSYPSLGT